MKKKNRTKRPISALTGIILSIFTENPFKAYNYKQVGHLIGVKDKAGRDLLLNVLEELTTAEDLNEIKRVNIYLTLKRFKSLPISKNI